MSSFEVSIDFWPPNEGLHASDSLSFCNFGITKAHEGEYVNQAQRVSTGYGVAITRIYQVMVLS